MHAPEAAEADLAGQCEKIPLHDARVTSVDCLVMITHVNTHATCFLLFREKSERARTCDWKTVKNLDTEDEDTCPRTEGGATDDCEDDGCNELTVAPRNLASARLLRVTETKTSQSLLNPQVYTPCSDTARIWGNAFGEMQRVSIICISPRGELTAEMSRRDIPRKEGK